MTGIESASPGRKGQYGRPHSYDPDFHGPVHKRSCTDVICALLFFVFLIGWGLVGGYAIYYGDPEILVFPTDSDGRKCGRDPEVADKQFLLYFDITQCSSPIVLIAGCPTPQVCVSQCPQENRFAVPYGLDERLCTAAARRSLTCRPGVDPTDTSRSCRSLLRDTDDCAPFTFRSAAVLGRCVPNLGIGDVQNGKVKDESGNEMNVTMDALYKGAEKLGVFVSLKDFGTYPVRFLPSFLLSILPLPFPPQHSSCPLSSSAPFLPSFLLGTLPALLPLQHPSCPLSFSAPFLPSSLASFLPSFLLSNSTLPALFPPQSQHPSCPLP